MSFQPEEPKDPKKVSTARLLIWLGAGGVAVYMIIQGVIGVIQHG